MSTCEVEALREQKREFYWFHDDDGMVVIHGRFTPEEGLVVCRTIDTMTKPTQEARQADWDAVHKGRMQAAARNIIARARDAEDRAIAGEDFNVPPDVEYERAEEKISAETYKQFMNQNRADAFVGLVEHFLATAPNYSQLQGLKGAERCQVVLRCFVGDGARERGWPGAERGSQVACGACAHPAGTGPKGVRQASITW